MAKSTFFFICLISLAVFIPAAFGAEGAPLPLTLDDYLRAAKEHKASIKDNDSINAKIFTPAISGNAAFSTFDGQTSFKANLVCSSDAPVVRVTAFPVGNLGAIGELNLRIEYDANLDGQFEGSVTINNVGGMCGNGFVRDCATAGSWKNCRFCKWAMENGVVKEKCDYGTTTQAAPIGPQDMTGCFCFNASCGSPVLSMLETTLSFAAKGVLDVLREHNNTLVITRSEFSPESMQLSYMGAKISNCEEVGNDATIAGLTGLVGKFEFPAGEALARAEAVPNHPYNAAMASFGQDNATFKKCVMQARVGVETRTVERSSLLDFGIGVDADGGSKQCYWFRHGYCGQVFGETKYLDVCISRIIPAALSDLCNQFLVNAGVFDQLTGISAYRATSGVANYIGCYGSENDRADQLWEVRCHGTRKEDVFVCKSPGMSLPGQTLKNEPYSPSLFQGCDEVLEPEGSCAPLEEERKNGECMLYSEVVDGVYTLREGSLTGLEPARSCKNTAGRSKSLTVCEPWWKKERVYRCTGQDLDFAKAKERAKYIGGTIGFDKETNAWSGQGDLTWDAAENQVKNVFDPAVEFQPNGKTCIPGCRVQTGAKVTDLFIPSQGKLASDGSYHMDSQGELSYTLNRDSVIRTARECEEKASGVYEYPLQLGETLVSGCECFDAGAFGEVVSTLAAINLASSNMICSTGNNVGVCSPEDMENGKNAVMCGEFKKNADGSVTPVGDGMTDCLPKLWKGTTAANQTHHVIVTSDYRCHVAAPALPEDDHFDNDLGSLIPQPAWFDAVAADAGLWIKEALKSDSAFIPDPEAYISTPLCSCKDGNFTRVGMVMGFREPAYMIDVVQDSWCFAGFGIDMGKSSVWGDGSSGGITSTKALRHEYSAHTHGYFYNPLYLLELLLDARCLEKMPIAISDISEVRPEHLDVQLNLMLYPQTLLFANPVAAAACMADVVASSAGFSLDALFWCAGEWGTIYPLTGTSASKGQSDVRAAANVAAKSIARSHQNLLLWGTKGQAALCGMYPQPVWIKSQYKLQPVRPVRSPLCPTIGRTELMWGAGQNPPSPGQTGNFAYLLWRWRDCCSF